METHPMSFRPSTDATAFSGGRVIPLGANQARLIVNQPQGAWWESVKNRLDELVALPPGWDGYAGVPVSFSNANYAVKVLEAVCGENSQPPQIVPGSSGDLQLEWHFPTGAIELHVRAANDVLAWYRDDTTGPDGIELSLTTNFIATSKWLEDLESASAAAAVGYDPLPDNDFHGEVWGARTRGQWRQLQAIAAWYVEISGTDLA
jgi:hypothetical protein